MALATCFSAVLARWGGLTRLCLTSPYSTASRCTRRLARCFRLHQYSSAGYRLRWRYRQQLARKNQLTFTEDWEHRHWSGSNYSVNSNASSATPTAPRWYYQQSGAFPLQQPRRIAVGRAEWGISQTPQVWIDHLAFEHTARSGYNGTATTRCSLRR